MTSDQMKAFLESCWDRYHEAGITVYCTLYTQRITYYTQRIYAPIGTSQAGTGGHVAVW